MAQAGGVFVGRERELARVAEVVTQVRGGQAWLVTVEGESGIGKTALVRQCLAAAGELDTWWARSDPAESDLDYGVLGQLLRGVARQVLAGYPALAGGSPAGSVLGVGRRCSAWSGR